MHRNVYWLAFLSFIVLIVVIYSGYTFYKIYQYDRLSQQVRVQSIQWSVVTVSEEEFIPQAHYQFQFQGKPYQGHTIWNETYLNSFAAQEKINKLNAVNGKVWIDSSNPHYSSLQKTFPLKQSISMVVLWILALYFIGLGRYVKSY